MTDSLKKEFWDRLEDTRTGMLAAGSAPAVPMSHFVEDDSTAPVLWFITAKSTALAEAANSGANAQYIVSTKDEHLYARIDGHVQAVNDPAQLDRIWNVMADVWFDGGQHDSDVQLLRMDLKQAEIWLTDGSIKFLFEVAKAHLTDQQPDVGQHGTVHF
jgi:general stress protein 26